MKYTFTSFSFCVATFLALGVQSAQALTEDYKLIADDAAAYDWFGSSVAVDGDTVVVGAFANDYRAFHDGSAYIFTRSGGGWIQQAELTASDAADADEFGYSVSVSGDTALVGAPGNWTNSGNSAYIFTRSGGVWTQQAKLTASDAAPGDSFGSSVSLSGDTAVISAVGDDAIGSAYIFTRSNGVWTQHAKLMASEAAPGDSFGSSVSLSGDTAVIGANLDDGGVGAGSAYVFTRNGSIWNQQAKLTASDAAMMGYFGVSVSISGDTTVVGAVGNGGGAYVFTRSGGIWSQQAKLTTSDAIDSFGVGVSVSGDMIVVGSPDIYSYTGPSSNVFSRNEGVWAQQVNLLASDGALHGVFGSAVSVAGNIAVIGAPADDSAGLESGSAYIFEFFDPHNADQDNDHIISLSELVRVVQFFNIGTLHCDAQGEDVFNPGVGDTSCTPYTGDYNPQDWSINLNELLRFIQLFNALRYYSCPGVGEDGFCPGTP